MPENNYNQRLNIKYNHLDVIDVPAIVAATTEKWSNQALTKINDSVARLAIIEGEYHWHKHDNEDEFFFVLEGKLYVDLEDQIIELGPMQGVTVGKGVVHRTRAPQKTVVLVLENDEMNLLGIN